MPPNATSTSSTSISSSVSVSATVPNNEQGNDVMSSNSINSDSSPSSGVNTKTFSYQSGSVLATTSIIEFGKSYHSTGICFLDHMVDQLTSHGQLGVTMKVFTKKNDKTTKIHQYISHEPHIDYAGGSLLEMDRIHDEDIFIACGATLGMALRDLAVGKRREYSVVTANKAVMGGMRPATESILSSSASSVFLCPLDEAFAEATLELEVEVDLSTTKHTTADVATTTTATATATTASQSFSCDLAPYGNIPPNVGRRWIGCYRCNLTPLFFEHLHQNLNNDTTHAKCNANLHLQKVRGHNAHHVVESTFKSFARVYRACLDELTRMNGHQHHGCIRVGENEKRLLTRRRAEEAEANDNDTGNDLVHHRTGSRSRSTKETTIEVNVDLDRRALPICTTTATQMSDNDTVDICTGVEITDQLLLEIRNCCGFHFNVHCNGDIYIDDHHTSEDVAITLGQCFNVALGDKAGLARMGCAEIAVGNNKGNATANHVIEIVRCVMDLSNRPYFEWDLPLDEEYVGGDEEAFAAMRRGAVIMNNKKSSGSNNNNNNNANINTTTAPPTMLCGSALTCEMLQHIFESLTIETRATVHMEILQHHVDNNDKAKSSSKKTINYKPYPGHTKELAFAAARAFGTALAECVRIDPRRAGKVASSKGTLSV